MIHSGQFAIGIFVICRPTVVLVVKLWIIMLSLADLGFGIWLEDCQCGGLCGALWYTFRGKEGCGSIGCLSDY